MTEERGKHYGVVHLKATTQSPATLCSFIEAATVVQDADDLIYLGAVYVNDVRSLSPDLQICTGDYVRVHTQPRRYRKPASLKTRILEVNEHYYIVDKPAGLPVHSQVDNCRENLASFLEEELSEKLFVTHRLDTETSGCLLIARTENARREINTLFRDRLIKKTYVAVTDRPVDVGHYIHFMEPSFKSPKILSSEAKDEWIRCELKITSCKSNSQNLFEVEIDLLTGRPQQIRAQLAHLGSPIVGDVRYGSSTPSPEPHAIALRCTQLDFDRSRITQP